MRQHRVTAVEKHDNPPHWRVMYDIDGAAHCHAFPADALLWRAAEYGVDPHNVDVLLNVVLHEPHMVGHDHTSPDFLYNTDRDTAARALHARVLKLQDEMRISDPDGLLRQIRDAHRVDPGDLEHRRRISDHVRQHGHLPLKEETGG